MPKLDQVPTVNAYATPESVLFNHLRTFAAKYIWWKTPEEAMRHPTRVIAQVMDLGEFRDVEELTNAAGEEVLRQTLQQAEAGWFSPRSWHFWHYRLRLCDVGEVPPLPQRTFS